jgi:hypothetical protein
MSRGSLVAISCVAAAFLGSWMVTRTILERGTSHPAMPITDDVAAPCRVASAEAPGSPVKGGTRAAPGHAPPGETAGRIPLPRLDDLARATLKDRRGVHLRTALLSEVGARVFTGPSCIPANHPGRSIIEVTVNIANTTVGEAQVSNARELLVREGAPLDDDGLRCLRSRLERAFLVTSPADHPFPVGFSGIVTVGIEVSSRIADPGRERIDP